MTFELDKRIAADSIFLQDLELCQLRMQNVKEFSWLVLIPRLPDLTEITDLSEVNQQLLMREIIYATKLLQRSFKPDKINIGALGNIVSQLHVHVVGRYKNDPAWPGPVWGYSPVTRIQ